MQRELLVVSSLALAVFAGCAIKPDTPPDVIPPRLVVGLLEVPPMEATTMSQMSITIRIGVINDDVRDLLVESLQVESVGVGPYEVARAERRFNRPIAPGKADTFEIFSNARAMTTSDRPAGQEGNVQIRVLGYFKTDAGAFKRLEIQSVGTTYANPAEAKPRSKD